MLRPPLSRQKFEGFVRAGEMNFVEKEDEKQKITDRTALDLLAKLIEQTQENYQNRANLEQNNQRVRQELALFPQREWSKMRQYDTYRIVNFESLAQMILKDDENFELHSEPSVQQ